jgi:hypothetical protein
MNYKIEEDDNSMRNASPKRTEQYAITPDRFHVLDHYGLEDCTYDAKYQDSFDHGIIP